MPNWNEVLNEMTILEQKSNPLDTVRKKYIKSLSDYMASEEHIQYWSFSFYD